IAVLEVGRATVGIDRGVFTIGRIDSLAVGVDRVAALSGFPEYPAILVVGRRITAVLLDCEPVFSNGLRVLRFRFLPPLPSAQSMAQLTVNIRIMFIEPKRLLKRADRLIEQFAP